MSDTHFWFGLFALKSCANKLGATGNECLLFVVALYFLAALALKPLLRMILATRCRPADTPSSRSLRATLGEPDRPFSSSNTRLTSTVSDRVAWPLAEGGLCFQA
jgi:hypothetical protein